MSPTLPPLVLEIEVACSVEHAFATWTKETSRWWPTDHSVSGERGLAVVFEPRVGGRIYERAPDGAQYDWGEIVAWDPPDRVAYLWHIRADRSDATDVEIAFVATGDTTLMRIEHTGWERLGAAATQRRSNNTRGWAAVLELYVEACVS